MSYFVSCRQNPFCGFLVYHWLKRGMKETSMTNISLTKQLHTCQLKYVLETIDSVNLCNAAFQRTLPCNDVMIKKKQASALRVPVKEIQNATPPHGLQ